MITLTPEAQAIVDAHQDLAIPMDRAPTVSFSRTEETYRHAKQACLALGFIEIDAECLAQAWLAMTLRKKLFDPLSWPTDGVDFGMKPFPRAAGFAPCPKELGLYAVLPNAAWVARMARAGVPTLQLRYKSDDPQAVRNEVQAAVRAVQGTQSLLFINDHWQEALQANAYGVHLGQEDLQSADIPALQAAGLRLGLSSHGYAEMMIADQYGPSYIAMGAVFPTTLKQMPTAPQGPGRLHAYAHLMRDYPLVAIGGIDGQNLSRVMTSGVGSVAVVRAITAAQNPEEASALLIAQMQQHRSDSLRA